MRFERKRQEYVKGLYKMRMPKVNREPVEAPVELVQLGLQAVEVVKPKYKVGDIVWTGNRQGRITWRGPFANTVAYEVIGVVEGWLEFCLEEELSLFTLENE